MKKEPLEGMEKKWKRRQSRSNGYSGSGKGALVLSRLNEVSLKRKGAALANGSIGVEANVANASGQRVASNEQRKRVKSSDGMQTLRNQKNVIERRKKS